MTAAVPVGPGAVSPPSLTAPCLCGRPDPNAAPAKKGKKGQKVVAPAPVLNYGQCCGPVLAGQALAPDAESLMRSRYCAFALQNRDYLLATWHASTRPDPLELDGATRWLGLTVQDHTVTGPDSATVRFVARWRQVGGRGGQAGRMSETSRFVREDGRWFYVDGDMDFGNAVGQEAAGAAAITPDRPADL